jgi:hypothetical protein
VRSLDHINIEIIIQQHTASNGGDTDGAVLESKLVERFGYQAVNRPMMTAGTVVARHLFQGSRALENGLDGTGHVKSLMLLQKIIGWLSKKFVLLGLVGFQGRRHTSGMSRS